MVEVSVDDKGKLTVPRVDTAIDCGTYVNPERIQAQIEGAAIMGLSLAKHGEITFKDGKVQQGNFDNFPVARIDEAPLVTNVHIVPPGADARRRRSGCSGPMSPGDGRHLLDGADLFDLQLRILAEGPAHLARHRRNEPVHPAVGARRFAM
jgi:hypothetical protein